MDKAQETFYTVIAEIAAFAFLYYVQYLLKVEGNLIFSSIILLVLLFIIWFMSIYKKVL